MAPKRQEHLKKLRGTLDSARTQAAKAGFAVTASEVGAKTGDVIVNIDEKALADQAEQLETILGTLDGQLSLKNATVMVSVP